MAATPSGMTRARLRLAPSGGHVFLSVRQDDLADRRRFGVDPPGCEGRVRRRHIERGHRDRAEAHRRDVLTAHLERRAHAELARGLADELGPDVQCQLGVHRVVRAEGRPRDRRPAVVGGVVRLDAPPGSVFAVAVRDRPVGERSGDVVARVRVDPPLDRCREDERLERGARLSPGLREQIELVVATPGNDRGHRTDGTVCRIDRDHRRGRVIRAR